MSVIFFNVTLKVSFMMYLPVSILRKIAVFNFAQPWQTLLFRLIFLGPWFGYVTQVPKSFKHFMPLQSILSRDSTFKPEFVVGLMVLGIMVLDEGSCLSLFFHRFIFPRLTRFFV